MSSAPWWPSQRERVQEVSRWPDGAESRCWPDAPTVAIFSCSVHHRPHLHSPGPPSQVQENNMLTHGGQRGHTGRKRCCGAHMRSDTMNGWSDWTERPSRRCCCLINYPMRSGSSRNSSVAQHLTNTCFTSTGVLLTRGLLLHGSVLWCRHTTSLSPVAMLSCR